MMRNGLILLFTFTWILQYAKSDDEMLLNPDCEEPLDGNWIGNGMDITQDTDAYTGVYSCKGSNA